MNNPEEPNMTLHEFTALVAEAEAAHPVWFGLASDSVPADSGLAAAEASLGAVLPEQYKEFLRHYGGGDFAFTNIFSLDEASDWNLLRIHADIGLLADRFLAISDNQAGDYYGFIVADGCCSTELYFYDHEDGQIRATQYEDIFSYIAQVGLRLAQA